MIDARVERTTSGYKVWGKNAALVLGAALIISGFMIFELRSPTRGINYGWLGVAGALMLAIPLILRFKPPLPDSESEQDHDQLPTISIEADKKR